MVFILVYWYTYNNRDGQPEISFVSSEDTKYEDNNEDVVGKININTASIEDLTENMFIDEEQARLVISYRDKNGNFDDIRDVADIAGVTHDTYYMIEFFSYAG